MKHWELLRDEEAIELLRTDICRTFAPGSTRERWLAWLEGIELSEGPAGARVMRIAYDERLRAPSLELTLRRFAAQLAIQSAWNFQKLV